MCFSFLFKGSQKPFCCSFTPLLNEISKLIFGINPAKGLGAETKYSQ